MERKSLKKSSNNKLHTSENSKQEELPTPSVDDKEKIKGNKKVQNQEPFITPAFIYLKNKLLNEKVEEGKDKGRNFWVSDENVQNCYNCGSKFYVFNGRHHCRICGNIFCKSCIITLDDLLLYDKKKSIKSMFLL